MYKTIYYENEKIWTGVRTTPFYNENLSVGQVILHSLESNPNHVSQVSKTDLFSFLYPLSIQQTTLILDQRQQWNDVNKS